MLSKNTKDRLISEFAEVKDGSNPKLNPIFDAIAVLSGESLDPVTDSGLKDTEKRLQAGFRVYRKIERLHGKPFLILTGSSIQNKAMLSMAAENDIKRVSILGNIPPAPNASTLDQFRELQKTKFKNFLIITQAYHFPRSKRYAEKFLAGKKYDFFLVERRAMRQVDINQEIKKIVKYSRSGMIDLFPKKIVAVIQARMSSTRLPGKVMMRIDGKPMLQYVVDRTMWAKSLSAVVVATSTDKSDDVIANYCKMQKIDYFRGSLEDVLGRYFHCAEKYSQDIVVRVTSDCPLIDGNLIDQGLKKFLKNGVDYLSNTVERTYPRGFDFEIFTGVALEKAYSKARDPWDREHVTPFIYNSREFKIGNLKNRQDKSKFRITVDTQEDFEVVKLLIDRFDAHKKGAQEIINILEKHPEISVINEKIRQKEYGKK